MKTIYIIAVVFTMACSATALPNTSQDQSRAIQHRNSIIVSLPKNIRISSYLSFPRLESRGYLRAQMALAQKDIHAGSWTRRKQSMNLYAGQIS
jgi:hypothetical protein